MSVTKAWRGPGRGRNVSVVLCSDYTDFSYSHQGAVSKDWSQWRKGIEVVENRYIFGRIS